MSTRRASALTLVIGLISGSLAAQEPPASGWAAPLYWSAGRIPKADARAARGDENDASVTVAPQAFSTSPVPLIAVTPCRIADTRDGTRPPGYGPPALTAGAPRQFTLTGVCGIAFDALAVSLNVTVVSPQGLGYILIYPEGGAQPIVSTLNYTAGVTVANAAIVPLGGTGGITVVAAVAGTELLIDTNGYYGPAGAGFENTFLGSGAGNFSMTGGDNSAFGNSALFNNTTGNVNTAVGAGALNANTDGTENTASGAFALYSNVSGDENTAVGTQALFNNTYGRFNTASGAYSLFTNTTGSSNTATGVGALRYNTTGVANTAVGNGALLDNATGTENTALGLGALLNNASGSYNTAGGSNALEANTTGDFNVSTGAYSLYFNTTGYNNTAAGYNALEFNGDGWYNTATGSEALRLNTTGTLNTAIGTQTLYSNTTGSYNIALGSGAGGNLDSGNSNIYIGNPGAPTESGTVRIGTFGTHSRVFMYGILGVTGSGVPMQIYADGQLGTVSSSARYKNDIQDMGESSDALLRLRPVTFRYKAGGGKQFGLVAEEVEDVLPDLVVRNAAGEVEAVQYHEMPAMLLNELQKQRRVIEALQKRLAVLEAGRCAAAEAPPSATE